MRDYLCSSSITSDSCQLPGQPHAHHRTGLHADNGYLVIPGSSAVSWFSPHRVSDDILNVRVQTLGVIEHSFPINIGGTMYDWKLYDVGGAVSLRCFPSANNLSRVFLAWSGECYPKESLAKKALSYVGRDTHGRPISKMVSTFRSRCANLISSVSVQQLPSSS